MLGEKVFYQFGNGGISGDDFYIFQPDNFASTNNVSVKRVTQNSSLFSGEARANGNKKNFKGSYIFNVKFFVKSKNRTSDHVDNVLKVFFSEPKLMIFYSWDPDGGGLKWYYNYGECIKPPAQVIASHKDWGQLEDLYEVDILMNGTEYYEVDDNDVYWVDNTALQSSSITWGQGGNTKWGHGGNVKWGNTFTGTHKLFAGSKYDNTTEIANIIQDFTGITSTTTHNIPIWVRDRYLTYPSQFNLGFNSTNAFLISLTDNTLHNTTSSPLDLKCSEECRVYEIQFTPLNKNETIVIKNTSNGSDITLTWLATNANANNVIFNSFFGTFFDVNTGAELAPENGFASFDFTTELLYFDNLRSENPFNNQTADNLTVQKTAASNNTVSIKHLRTFN